jgi:2-octaprenyl-6-methoxyphenol hydroxylase
LGAALLAQLATLENVQLVCPANMLNLRLEEDRARVELDCDGEQRTVSGRLLVIADGGRSRARQMLGIGARRVDYGQTAVISNVTPELAHGNVAYERFTRSGPLALLPMTEGRCSLVWSVHPRQVDELLGLDDGLFLRRLHERFGDRLGAFQRVGRRHAYPLALMRVHEHVRPRVALIGNAAHALHPVAGQGFNLGLRDVAALAQVVNDALRDGQDFGALAVLSRYAAWRRRDNLAVTAFTDGLVRVFSNEFLPLVMARDAGLVAVDLLPPLKRALERRTMGLAGRLSRLARGLSLCG